MFGAPSRADHHLSNQGNEQVVFNDDYEDRSTRCKSFSIVALYFHLLNASPFRRQLLSKGQLLRFATSPSLQRSAISSAHRSQEFPSMSLPSLNPSGFANAHSSRNAGPI